MSIPSKDEIVAAAQKLSADAASLEAHTEASIAAAEKAYSGRHGQGIAAKQAAGSAQSAAGEALVAAGKDNLKEAWAQLSAARRQYDKAAEWAARPSEPGDALSEWKECRSTIDRFDKILVDLRKTGFSFLTAVVGAAAIWQLSAQNTAANMALVKVCVFLIVTGLTVLLHEIDRVHRVWLIETVQLACKLEEKLDYHVTRNLRGRIGSFGAQLIGGMSYFGFLLITAIAFLMSMGAALDPRLWDNNQLWIGAICLAGMLLMLGAGLIGGLWRRRMRS